MGSTPPHRLLTLRGVAHRVGVDGHRLGIPVPVPFPPQVSKSLDKAESAVQALQTAILEVGGDRLKKAVKRAEAASK